MVIVGPTSHFDGRRRNKKHFCAEDGKSGIHDFFASGDIFSFILFDLGQEQPAAGEIGYNQFRGEIGEVAIYSQEMKTQEQSTHLGLEIKSLSSPSPSAGRQVFSVEKTGGQAPRRPVL